MNTRPHDADGTMTMLAQLVHKVRVGIEIAAQSVLFCMELFNRNGLANHAAAGAYGFLFAGTPTLLIIFLVVSRIMATSPESTVVLLTNIPMVGSFDMKNLVSGFFSSAQGGFAGVVSVFGLFLTARIFALTLQRGLTMVFPDPEKVNRVRKLATPFAISVLLIIAIMSFLLLAAFAGDAATPLIFTLLAGFVFCAYFFTPLSRVKAGAALTGCFICIICYAVVFQCSRFIFNPETYHIRYGSLGDLLLLLVNIYFFFTFFYMGAQLTFVVQHFDALLFSRLAQTKPVNAFMKALFTSTRGPLGKYLHVYKKGEEIFHQGEMSKEVYYIMKGEAAVFLHDQQVSVVGSGKFFGEMGHILGEQRSATMKAHTDLDTLVLSPSLFEEVLHSDPDIDKRVINTFSRRLKDSNKKISSDSVLSEAAPEESKPRKKAKKRKKR